MASGPQLTIDGREELYERTARCNALTAVQLDILRVLAERRTITSSEAGRLVHAHRQPSCERCKRGRCGFTSTDGTAALRRLQERGLARRIAAGLWSATGELTPDRLPAMSDAVRGPKGARVGDVVIAERSRWHVERVYPERREVLCRLIGGSRVLRRFRARQISKVERGAV